MKTESADQFDTDRLLFEALIEGDSYAMSELVQRHERWVRSVVYGVLGRSEELDDVVQQVWLNVWRRADSLQSPQYWKTWLYRLARNTAIDAGRKVTRRRGLWKRFTEDRTHETEHDRPIESDLVLEEKHKAVLEAIDNPPAIYREPFIMRHMEDWSYKQISEAMSLPINTVEIRLVRARRKLREMLEGEK